MRVKFRKEKKDYIEERHIQWLYAHFIWHNLVLGHSHLAGIASYYEMNNSTQAGFYFYLI